MQVPANVKHESIIMYSYNTIPHLRLRAMCIAANPMKAWPIAAERAEVKLYNPITRIRQSSIDCIRSSAETLTEDERAHVSWRLGVRILQASDGSKDFSQANEHIGTRLAPDVQWRDSVARAHIMPACSGLVDVILDHSGPDHRCAGHEERSAHAT